MPGTAGADVPPSSCLIDPAFGPGGFATTPAFGDGYTLDRVTLDKQGRLYTISHLVVDDSYVVDRVRRFLPDGTPDASYGTNGQIDLAGQMFSLGTRNLIVDGMGRLWIARASFSNAVEVLRLLPNGQADPAMQISELVLAPGWNIDPVGALVLKESSANEVLLLLGGENPQGEGYVGSVHVAANGGRLVLGGLENSLPNHRPRVLAGTGFWVAGVMVPEEPGQPFFPFVWRSTGVQWDLYIDPNPGFVDQLIDLDGQIIATGSSYDPVTDTSQALSLHFSKSIRGDRPALAGPGRVLTDLGDSSSILGVFPDRTVFGTTGPWAERRLFVGKLNQDGTVSMEADVPNVVLPVSPAAFAEVDGMKTFAGYHALEDQQQAFIAGLNSEIGPPAAEGSLDDQVARLYRAFFRREPDPGGQAFWNDQRASGRTLESIADEFAGSVEFRRTYGSLADHRFVQQVYRNVLGRDADAAGFDFWWESLRSGQVTRGEMMVSFSESPEQIDASGTVAPHDGPTGQLYRLYRAYFQRDSDVGGSCFWVRRLAGGVPLTSVSDSFASSAEFQATYGSLSNRAFVELVYQNVLGRPGEASGIDFWTGELDAGRRTRGEVMVGFSESVEFIIRTGTLPAES